MDNDELKKRINAYNEKMMRGNRNIANSDDNTESDVVVNDVWEDKENQIKSEIKASSPNGSPSVVKKLTERLTASLSLAYKKAKHDSDFEKSRGENEKANLIKIQYMREKFLPTVETLLFFAAPSEVLNAKTSLDLLDRYVLYDGGQSGWTYNYIKTVYKDFEKQTKNLSDESVKQAVIDIKKMAFDGKNRSAASLAKKMIDSIRSGEHIASDADYDILTRVSNLIG